jgi:hypothetical protein
MALIVVEMTGAIVLMLKLAIPTPAKGHEGRVATNPLLTTARFDQRHPLTATEPTMLASHRFGFHPVVSQRLSFIRRDVGLQVDIHTPVSLYCMASAFKSQDDLVAVSDCVNVYQNGQFEIAAFFRHGTCYMTPVEIL